jgi:hypothetical protein
MDNADKEKHHCPDDAPKGLKSKLGKKDKHTAEMNKQGDATTCDDCGREVDGYLSDVLERFGIQI